MGDREKKARHRYNNRKCTFIIGKLSESLNGKTDYRISKKSIMRSYSHVIPVIFITIDTINSPLYRLPKHINYNFNCSKECKETGKGSYSNSHNYFSHVKTKDDMKVRKKSDCRVKLCSVTNIF